MDNDNVIQFPTGRKPQADFKGVVIDILKAVADDTIFKNMNDQIQERINSIELENNAPVREEDKSLVSTGAMAGYNIIMNEIKEIIDKNNIVDNSL